MLEEYLHEKRTLYRRHFVPNLMFDIKRDKKTTKTFISNEKNKISYHVVFIFVECMRGMYDN